MYGIPIFIFNYMYKIPKFIFAIADKIPKFFSSILYGIPKFDSAEGVTRYAMLVVCRPFGAFILQYQ